MSRLAEAFGRDSDDAIYFLSLADCPACALVSPHIAQLEHVRSVHRIDAAASHIPPLKVPALAWCEGGAWKLAETSDGVIAAVKRLMR